MGWTDLRRVIPGLPPVVAVVLPAREYSRRGHFSIDAWRLKNNQEEALHEVAVHPGMFETPEDLLITVLHEAAHAILWEDRKPEDRHVGGVSLSGYYHRTEFRDAARSLGLEVHFLNRRYGFSVTTWPATGIPEKYRHILGTLGRFGIVGSRRLPPRVVPAPPRKLSRWVTLRCECDPARAIHVTPCDLRRGSIACGICGTDFV